MIGYKLLYSCYAITTVLCLVMIGVHGIRDAKTVMNKRFCSVIQDVIATSSVIYNTGICCYRTIIVISRCSKHC